MAKADCTRNCWIAGGIVGLLVWIFAGIGDLRWYEALFLGLITAFLVGRLLIWALCDGDQEQPVDAVTQPVAAAAPMAAAAAPAAAVTAAPKAETPKAAAPAQPASAPAPAPEKPAKTQSTAPAKPAKAAPKKPAQPDDLKQIKGVGPKLEELLHANGITQFAQIADWSDADIDHFAEVIGRMGGRIRSDDWKAQARVLAAGGETEFSQRVDKGEVY